VSDRAGVSLKGCPGPLSGERLNGLSKPHTEKGRLQRACLALLREHQADGALPTSIRFVFYELVSREEVPKAYPAGKRRTPSQNVADAVKHLREAGIVPWAWIVDETRALHSQRYASSVYEYVEDVLPTARIDLWNSEPPPLVLCESRSLAGVLRDIAAAYLCPIAATNGQAGGFLHTMVGPILAQHGGVRRVFYLGDLDLSGGHIEENTCKVLSEYAALKWERLAITDVQVREHGLTRIHKTDKRFNPPRTFPAVETEALRQQEIQRILTTRLAAELPEPLSVAREREAQQRAEVRERLG
jgi:hypothetical protein